MIILALPLLALLFLAMLRLIRHAETAIERRRQGRSRGVGGSSPAEPDRVKRA